MESLRTKPSKNPSGALSSAQGHGSQERVIRETPFGSAPCFLKAEAEREQSLTPQGPLGWEAWVGAPCENGKTSEHSRAQNCVCGHPQPFQKHSCATCPSKNELSSGILG